MINLRNVCLHIIFILCDKSDIFTNGAITFRAHYNTLFHVCTSLSSNDISSILVNHYIVVITHKSS